METLRGLEIAGGGRIELCVGDLTALEPADGVNLMIEAACRDLAASLWSS